MIYMLDTNVMIDLSRRRPTPIRDRIERARVTGDSLILSSITYFELQHGLARTKHREQNAAILEGFIFAALEIVPFIDEDAVIAGELRWSLESQGRRIGPYDLLIAAQALRTGATLVTANVSEFNRVRDLAWEDWTRTD
ncbi:MAG TPA: type II toxin-antitoxin system VapC family toxin [Thermomicrobiales bacterium]|nr:type II toxin-antitoxin system VapC family toxin [Thermomicrobiales bacterium]